MTDATSSGNAIQGNYIGIDVTGTTALANAVGIYLNGSGGTTIGGAGGLLNVISGNATRGVSLSNSDGNTISANYVGLNAAGTGTINNGNEGIWLTGSANNLIGDPSAGLGNVVAGNTRGVYINGAGSTGNVVAGNIVGLDPTGTLATGFGNSMQGVFVGGGASGNTIGGVTAADRNIISGNTSNGVVIRDVGTDNNTILGNYIGTDITGTLDRGNGVTGVTVYWVRQTT